MDNSARFTADFVLERKAVVEETDSGDVIIEGYAADWLTDRQEDAFEPGAFDMGLKAFMEKNPILVYHHHYDQALGQVIEATNKPDGLWVKARVDRPTPGSWAEDIVSKVKRGTIRGFSVGGRFHRRRGADGRPRIYQADIMELSITPLPINQRTLFQVAGKAFGEDEGPRARALRGAEAIIERLERVFSSVDGALESKAATQAKRDRAAKSGAAFSDGSYPIENCQDVKDAYGLRNSSKRHSASEVEAHIRKRAKALGCPDPFAD